MAALSNTTVLIFVAVFLGIVMQDIEAGGNYSIQVPIRRRIRSLPGRKCLNLLWDGVCENKVCKTKIERKLSKVGASTTSTIPLFHPFTTANNYSHAVCYYDGSSENTSCCGEITPGLTTGEATSFGDYDNIGFKISVCHYNETGNCAIVESNFVLPWKDLCLLDKPCGNEGSCKAVKPGEYNCTCYISWRGENCTIPDDYTYYAHKCLENSGVVEELLNKTTKECSSRCVSMGSSKCKSFEFKSSGGRQGKCALKNANTLHNKLVDCNSDFFELTKLTKSAGSRMSAVFATCSVLVALFSHLFLTE